ncbi:MAG: hypothetical protein WCZ90_06380 [Melioribacteraceae bacterium]
MKTITITSISTNEIQASLTGFLAGSELLMIIASLFLLAVLVVIKIYSIKKV